MLDCLTVKDHETLVYYRLAAKAERHHFGVMEKLKSRINQKCISEIKSDEAKDANR